MNVQASKTHQEGIYINRVSYILGSQFALSHPPRTYRKKTIHFFSLHSMPSRYEAFQKEMDYVKLMWKKRNEWKIEDAGIATLFGLECFAWYCTGEIVGRGFTFTGYYI
ncbi:hypothetical protein ES332_A05G047600v1 [Gossypium tomentosum]|uniref:ATP synthase subunit n=1 Tax=Gossypium tomentosum TaxID=34277 RepID=A0A5D2QA56_GOSTO|nr:hypothetical protein ES332_A05G047600v1 [Gossypium tomentosum]